MLFKAILLDAFDNELAGSTKTKSGVLPEAPSHEEGSQLAGYGMMR